MQRDQLRKQDRKAFQALVVLSKSFPEELNLDQTALGYRRPNLEIKEVGIGSGPRLAALFCRQRQGRETARVAVD